MVALRGGGGGGRIEKTRTWPLGVVALWTTERHWIRRRLVGDLHGWRFTRFSVMVVSRIRRQLEQSRKQITSGFVRHNLVYAQQ